MNKEQVMELYMIDIERIQVHKRGLGISQQLLYQKLRDNNVEFGENSFRNGKIMSSGRYSDKGVRRDLFRLNNHFWFINDEGKKEYLPSDQEMWDIVETNIKIRDRNNNIDDLLDN
jgi:hypothetical protein